MNRSFTHTGRRSHRPARIAGGVLALVLVLVVAAAAGCGSSSSGSSASPSATGAIKQGGILKIGSQPGNVNFDPALFAGAVPDILLQQQIYEKLVTLGAGLRRAADARHRSGTSPDGKVVDVHAA